jgi:hypothetical protein
MSEENMCSILEGEFLIKLQKWDEDTNKMPSRMILAFSLVKARIMGKLMDLITLVHVKRLSRNAQSSHVVHAPPDHCCV